jgi:hypothetical protein
MWCSCRVINGVTHNFFCAGALVEFESLSLQRVCPCSKSGCCLVAIEACGKPACARSLSAQFGRGLICRLGHGVPHYVDQGECWHLSATGVLNGGGQRWLHAARNPEDCLPPVPHRLRPAQRLAAVPGRRNCDLVSVPRALLAGRLTAVLGRPS